MDQTGTPSTNNATPERGVRTIRTPLAPDEAMRRLHAMARGGNLPEFENHGPVAFSAIAFGGTYDRTIDGFITGGADGGSEVRITSRARYRLLAIVAVVYALATWPGAWITESMLQTYFPDSLVANYTYWWYIPLMILGVPALVGQWRSSQRAARQSEAELAERIAKALDGSVTTPKAGAGDRPSAG